MGRQAHLIGTPRGLHHKRAVQKGCFTVCVVLRDCHQEGSGDTRPESGRGQISVPAPPQCEDESKDYRNYGRASAYD